MPPFDANAADYIPISGSVAPTLPGTEELGRGDPALEFEVTVALRERQSGLSLPRRVDDLISRPVEEREHLSRKQYLDDHGADPSDIEQIERFAADHRLTVMGCDPASRRVTLHGTAAALSTAFNTEVTRRRVNGHEYRSHTGSVEVPQQLAPIIEGVFGFDVRPLAHPYVRALPQAQQHYSPDAVAKIYNFPKDAHAKPIHATGQTIAIIELGGGYSETDIATYFAERHLPAPRVRWVSVDGGKNRFTGNPRSADGEVALDIQVAGAVAPGCDIVVYFAPNTEQGFIDAVATAAHDAAHNPSVISISWGAPERDWTHQGMRNFDAACQAAAAMGVSIFCASGDNLSNDGVLDGRQHVDFPASGPHVTGCGGTTLPDGNRRHERVWNNGSGEGTGGGVSDVFALPGWQKRARPPRSANDGHIGRAVPDVSGDADPATGYEIMVGGRHYVFGGTSAVAPLWAGLTAVVNKVLGKPIGFLNPGLYANAQRGAKGAVDIPAGRGNNGAYRSRRGYDCCTGLGTPDGEALLHEFRAHRVQGHGIPSAPAGSPASGGRDGLAA